MINRLLIYVLPSENVIKSTSRFFFQPYLKLSFLAHFPLTCIAGSHSYRRRCPPSESQNCQIREWNCQRWESVGNVGAQKSPDIAGLAPPGSRWSSALARGTFGWSRTENTTLLPRNHILGGLLDRATFTNKPSLEVD